MSKRHKVSFIVNLSIIFCLSLLLVTAFACKNKKDIVSNVSANISENKLPKLIDLGSKTCIPCKMMMPVLDELKTEYAGKLNIEFIDVWENTKESEKYGVKIIPTQIFFDPEGKEFFRHEGFFAKEDILNEFKKKGIKFD